MKGGRREWEREEIENETVTTWERWERGKCKKVVKRGCGGGEEVVGDDERLLQNANNFFKKNNDEEDDNCVFECSTTLLPGNCRTFRMSFPKGLQLGAMRVMVQTERENERESEKKREGERKREGKKKSGGDDGGVCWLGCLVGPTTGDCATSYGSSCPVLGIFVKISIIFIFIFIFYLFFIYFYFYFYFYFYIYISISISISISIYIIYQYLIYLLQTPCP